jgi:hypothetical protein
VISVQLDTKAFEAQMNEVGARQFNFAVSKGMNDLGIRAAEAERAVARRNLTIRDGNVLKYGIARIKQAKHNDLTVDVGVSQQQSGNRKAFTYLEKFEEGGRKGPDASKPFGGAGDRDSTVAVPTQEIRRSRRGLIRASQRIAAFNFRQKGRQIMGDKRTFILKSKTGRSAGVIVQRVANTKRRRMGVQQAGHDSGLKVLYVLERSVAIRPILHFHETMMRVAREQWGDAWAKAWQYTLATMKK